MNDKQKTGITGFDSQSFGAKYFRGDKGFWIILLLLSAISLLAVYSSTKDLFGRAVFVFIGLAIVWVVHLIKYTRYYYMSFIIYFVSIALLVLTLIVGATTNDATRWIKIPIINMTFQTSEFAKVALIMFLAYLFSEHQEKLKERATFLKIAICTVIPCGLIFLDNFSTAAILFLVAWLMMLIVGIPAKYLFGLASSIILLGVFVIGLSFIVPKEYMPKPFSRVYTWKHRMENFIKETPNASEDLTTNFQENQAKIAIAEGTENIIIGKMPGNSSQRYFLPHRESDFIYAFIIEEWGWVGAVLVLFAYLWIFRRCTLIARKCEKNFGMYLVLGFGLLYTIQALVNMGVSVTILPVTGQTLPFVSAGGSSQIITAVAFGIILNISSQQDV
ncbi:MAG: FtsW/RodA/SpoVE family cell cycle protein [Bacteroidales bacterium]|jgi:cell division protein FtsW|nr:FtsW/RodA/SpoVE family cell cycle protein [Bacteroidales bacterium]